ncbi:hypothetical protein IQ255_09800 [Pleurocapsales cyanobacterium LEGE 10410]|nr:hypothetical protein [Pleurocapsales cyanobacterium LEGE 10410]
MLKIIVERLIKTNINVKKKRSLVGNSKSDREKYLEKQRLVVPFKE